MRSRKDEKITFMQWMGKQISFDDFIAKAEKEKWLEIDAQRECATLTSLGLAVGLLLMAHVPPILIHDVLKALQEHQNLQYGKPGTWELDYLAKLDMPHA